MRTSDVIDYIGCTTLIMVVVALGIALDQRKHTVVQNPPDTAGFWQQANTAKQHECREIIVKAVLSMKLPNEAYTDPALAKAMDDAFILCP